LPPQATASITEETCLTVGRITTLRSFNTLSVDAACVGFTVGVLQAGIGRLAKAIKTGFTCTAVHITGAL
jgi:hypothetical protein